MKTHAIRSVALGALALALAGCPVKPEDPLPPPPAAKITTFTANPTMVANPGDSVTLSWAAENATSVSLEQVGVGPVAGASAASGTASVAVTADSIFVLTARGEGGTDARSLGVSVAGETGSVLFAALPEKIEAGQSATLTWYAPGAQAVTLEAVGGAMIDVMGQKENGTVTVSPDTTTSYRLTVDGQASTVSVAVSPVIEAFALDGTAPEAGGMAKLTWRTRGATAVALSRSGVMTPLVTEMDLAKVAQGDFTDTVPADLPANGVLSYTLVASVGTQQVMKSLEVRTAGGLRFVKSSIPGYGRLGSNVPVSWETAGAQALRIEVNGRTTFIASTAAQVALGNTVVDVTPTAQTVKLIATNSLGERAEVTGTIEPVGGITFNSFTATPTTATNGGDAVTLAWDVTNARRVKVSQVGGGFSSERIGTLDTGTVSVRPNRASVTYRLEADNQAGDAIDPQVVTVTVTTPGVVNVSRKLPSGAATTVTGTTVTGATTVYGLPTATLNVMGAAFVDISTTGTEIANFATTSGTPNTNDGTALVNLPGMDLRVFGQPVDATRMSVSTNGWFYFSSANNATTIPSVPVTTNLQPLSIVPFGQNLLLGDVGRVHWQQDQVMGVDRLIVQWTNVESSGATTSNITFQAQVYSTGEIVFAYQTIENVTANWSAGVVNGNETAYLQPAMRPAAGETATFFAGVPVASLPVPHTITVLPYWVTVAATGGTVFEAFLDDTLLAGELAITEINPRPTTGLVDAEWVELTNTSTSPIDLQDWTMVQGTQTYTFPAGVTVPANSRLLLAQANDLGDGATVTVGHLYPTTFLMPDTSGQLALRPPMSTTNFARFDWNAATAPAGGRAVQADPASSSFRVASPFSAPTCPAPTANTYGSGAQIGTPGAAQPKCFPYVLETLPPGGFEAIASSGTLIVAASDPASDDSTYPITLPQAVSYFGTTSTSLSVCTNGWLSTTATTSTSSSNKSTPSTTVPVGAISPYWDFIIGEGAQMTNGMYWVQRDPDMTPGTGDEVTIVSWEGWRYDSTSYAGQVLDFQVKFLANGDLEFHFGRQITTTTLMQGSSATTWIENPAGTAALAINVNSSTSPGIQGNTSFRFRYTP